MKYLKSAFFFTLLACTAFSTIQAKEIEFAGWTSGTAQGLTKGFMLIPLRFAETIKIASQKIEKSFSAVVKSVEHLTPGEATHASMAGKLVGELVGYVFALTLLERSLNGLAAKGTISPQTSKTLYRLGLFAPLVAGISRATLSSEENSVAKHCN